MATKQHGEIVSTDHTTGNRGVHTIEGFNTVADEAARNAIVQTAADRGRFVYQSGGTYPGWYVALGVTGSWRGASLATADALAIYVRDADGSDSNAGTSGAPLKTLDEALRRIPDVIKHATVIHLGDGTYTLPNIARTLAAPFAIIGDGAGTGDGFTETQAPELADTGTGAATVVKTGGGLTPDAFLGHTIEITAGPGAGQRRIVRENTATAFTFTRNFDVPPTSASTYRIVRPAVTLTSSTGVLISCNGTTDSTFTAGARSTASTHFVFAQVKITMAAGLGIATESDTVFYGVELDTTAFWVLGGLGEKLLGNEGSTVGAAGVLPVQLFGAGSSGDWFGWGMGVPGGGVFSAFVEYTSVRGFVAGNCRLVPGAGSFYSLQGGRFAPTTTEGTVIASFGAAVSCTGFHLENKGTGHVIESRDNAFVFFGSGTLKSTTGSLMRARRSGLITMSVSVTGSTSGKVASAEGGTIHFSANPGIDGGTPGSDYSAGIASPVLAGKGAFTSPGDAISKADGSLIVRSN